MSPEDSGDYEIIYIADGKEDMPRSWWNDNWGLVVAALGALIICGAFFIWPLT
jgi:hypothetical protein